MDALLLVNWLFWGALSVGTLLVVGATEVLGGTTTGYRRFMAALIVVLAAVLLASELSLAVPEATASTHLRRPLAVAFAVGSAAYLLASIAQRPSAHVRGVGAMLAAAAGLAALIALAASSGTRSGSLFAGQVVLATLALGAVTAGMLLGHWYLVTPRLSPAPLRRMMWLLVVALLLQAAAFGLALALVGTDPLAGGMAWLTWLRLAAGVMLPLLATALAILASRSASLQASTGLLYIGMALVIAGSIAGASIGYLTGVPV